jgi:hypothetical protein
MRNQEPRTNKSDWSIRISYALKVYMYLKIIGNTDKPNNNPQSILIVEAQFSLTQWRKRVQ